jgi:hypothetical protein
MICNPLSQDLRARFVSAACLQAKLKNKVAVLIKARHDRAKAVEMASGM